MNQPTGGDETSPDVKLCECGCGRAAPIAKSTRRKHGQIKGQPGRFIQGHVGGPSLALFVEVGQRIGHGVVVESELRIPSKRRPQGRGIRAARLLCGCGNEYVKTLEVLVGNQAAVMHSTSCGCQKECQPLASRPESAPVGEAPMCRCGCGAPVAWHVQEGRWHAYVTGHFRRRANPGVLVGRRFGKLTVLRYAGEEEASSGLPRHLWLCGCDCGNEVVVPGANLKAAHGKTRGVTSCGCSRRGPKLGKRKPEDRTISWRPARNKVLGIYKKNAERAGRVWDLSDEDFDRLTSLNCHYCGSPPSTVMRLGRYEGSTFTYNGLDRVDNDLAYTLDNVLPCCSQCNRAKSDMPYDDFAAWIARLTEYHFFHPDVMPSALLRKAAAS